MGSTEQSERYPTFQGCGGSRGLGRLSGTPADVAAGLSVERGTVAVQLCRTVGVLCTPTI